MGCWSHVEPVNFLGDGFPFLQNWRQELYTPPPRQNEARHINKALKEENTERQTGLKLDGQYAVCNSLRAAAGVSQGGSKQVCFLKGMHDFWNPNQGKCGPMWGKHWPRTRVRGQHLGGCSGLWQWVCVTSLGTTGMALCALSARPGDRGQPRNEEQERCFDKAAVTGITTRISNHMQTNLWKTVGKACRAQKSERSGNYLHGVLWELPLQTLRRQRQDTQDPVFSDCEGPAKLAQDLKMEVEPTVIVTSA